MSCPSPNEGAKKAIEIRYGKDVGFNHGGETRGVRRRSATAAKRVERIASEVLAGARTFLLVISDPRG